MLYEFDLSESEVKAFAEQYQKGRVLFTGKWIDVPDIEEIEIRETPYNSNTYKSINPLLPVGDIIFRDSYNLQTEAKVVTRQLFKSEPKKFIEKSARQLIPSRNVFIVHGHDVQPVKELKKMLIEFGLNPIVLHEQPSGSRTIIEKLEKYSDVGYAFVILTPDDLALPNTLPIIPPLPPELPFKHRARQNVVLEFGYFMGLLGRDRVCCLHKGDVELPSDMHGIVYIPFEKSLEECRDMIVKNLRDAGYKI